MSAPKLLGLPPLSPALKSITPFLQRADELKEKDPIMTYWCAYHAAQLGISLKAKDAQSRKVLYELLGTLENMKSAIGASDAIDLEAASSAYVETFALRVFGLADNEDRNGQPTRATAKKFLAAANFFEVLKVFSQSPLSEMTEEKIRYAKWKAADISKALREGRTLAPGPPGSLDQELATPPLNGTFTTESSGSGSPPKSSSSRSQTSQPRAGSLTPPEIKRHSPPDSHTSLPHTPPRPPHLDSVSLAPRFGGQGDATPGSWSTAATPGAATPRNAVGDTSFQEPESPSVSKAKRERRSGSGSSSGSSGGTADLWDKGTRRSSISQKSPSSPEESSAKKSVHFTPSVTGGSVGGSAPSTPGTESSFNFAESQVRQQSIYVPVPQTPTGQPGQPNHSVYYDHVAPGYIPPTTHASAPPLTPHIYPSPSAPPAAYSSNHVYGGPSNANFATPPVAVDSQPFELTPAIIAKAQKHCRFAISSLDYEDAEQARKELRAALKILGG